MARNSLKQVTKSVRFSPEESAVIERVSEREHLPEGTLMRKLVLEGLARYRLEQAIADYESGEINLGEAAHAAGVSIRRMMVELEHRGTGLRGEAHVVTSLENLTALFGGSQEMHETIAMLRRSQAVRGGPAGGDANEP
jgi:predicted HTH domain antitoxin